MKRTEIRVSGSASSYDEGHLILVRAPAGGPCCCSRVSMRRRDPAKVVNGGGEIGSLGNDRVSDDLFMHVRVLHLSHTDIRADSRVLKQLNSLREGIPSAEVHAYGLANREGGPDGSPRAPDGLRIISPASRRLRFVGRHVRYVATWAEMSCRMLAAGWRVRPSLVHCHDILVLPAAYVISRLCGSALVYDAHELESERNGMSRRGSRWCLQIERWCWRRISLLVSVSPSILEWYSENLGPKPSVLVLNSPVLPAPCPSEVVRERRSFGEQGYFHKCFGIPEGTPVFIYLGLLVRGRGIEPVLEVFGRPRLRSHVVFMGYGDTVGVSSHAERFPNIHLHPAVPHDQVVQIVREADCGLCLIEDVSLSDRLCLPNKLFEYAFAGVPVLASRLPEIARVVGDFGLGICCDNDADSIEAAVRKIEREGLEPPTGDLTELSWETQAKRLQEAYRTLLAERKLVATGTKGEH